MTAEPAPAAPALAPAPAAPAPPAPAQPETSEPAPASTALGLPKRRRREPVPEHVAATRAPVAQPGAEPPPARPAHETASRMGAFARGTRSGRLSSPDDEGTPQR
ncbi:hypothetical protein BEN35_19795 [Streptomyces fradiae]|nr:hypothetical protein BEN35_19795 [Streptomyces fradiae]